MLADLKFDEIKQKRACAGCARMFLEDKNSCAGWANKKPLRIGWGW